MLVRRCDFCGRIDEEGDWDLAHSQYCDRCEERLQLMEIKAFEEMQSKFEAHIAAQVSTLSLLEFISIEKAAEFEEHFGTQGVELLKKALADVHA